MHITECISVTIQIYTKEVILWSICKVEILCWNGIRVDIFKLMIAEWFARPLFGTLDLKASLDACVFLMRTTRIRT